MEDRLRQIIDLVVTSLDAPADGRALAERAAFSRDHLDRLLAAATGGTPVALRRRLLLERAAWELRADGASASEAAARAGYTSLAAFSRAFSRAYGMPPSAFAAAERDVALDAPNGIHFLPPAGLTVPATRPAPATRAPAAAAGHDLTHRLVAHHLDRTRELLVLLATVPVADRERALRPGFTVLSWEGEEPSAALMAERLVATLEVWVAAIDGTRPPEGGGDLVERLDRAGTAFARFARRVRDAGAWDDAFVDALCEPPQAFTYGGVIAHVVTFGALRRETLAGVLRELGVRVEDGDPILWEAERRRRVGG